ncbi:MAG: von Willebrand factor type A domain-containing protein, partial [Proteobacteria bacterium]|nr:von Willebrand factor type A domain-containing protein [Pseudomonadota bacterium]
MKNVKHYALLGSLFLMTSMVCGCGDDGGNWGSADAMKANIGYATNSPDASIAAENAEAYKPPAEEQSNDFEPKAFTNPRNAPQSTFAADVDTASYTLFRLRVHNGMNPKITDNNYGQPSPYRTEEMVNYFKYDYPAPINDEVISITTEYAPCPWNDQTKLLLIGTQTKKLETTPASNLVFLVDVSGSMNNEQSLPLLKKSIIQFLPTMTEADRVSIVTYADGEKLVIDGANPVKDRAKLESAINNLKAGGSTNGERGLELAYETAQKHFIKDGNNRILMGTDGDLNVGISSEEELKAYVEQKREQGIYLSILGFGYGNFRDGLLETIADNGNGSYHYIDSTLEAERVLVEDRDSTLFVAAKDMKFQVSFNPEKVSGYRLIGYENRVMAAEDFADDTKDGGEVGVNHQVTVLYEIAEPGADVAIDAYKEASPAVVMPEFKNGEMASLAIRYKMPTGDAPSVERTFSIDMPAAAMSNNMTFASSVAEFSMLLNESKFAKSGSVDHVLTQLKSIPNSYYDKYKNEFIELVEASKPLMTNK